MCSDSIVMWESLFGEVEKWYRYRLQEIFAIEENKKFWDVSIQCGHVIVVRKAYIIDKKVDAETVEVAFPGDTRMRNKEMEKIKKKSKFTERDWETSEHEKSICYTCSACFFFISMTFISIYRLMFGDFLSIC